MAGIDRETRAIEGLGYRRVLLFGSFAPNGTSDPTGLDGDLYKLGTVAYDDVGTLIYTFTEKPGQILEARAELRGDFTEGDQCCVGSFDSDAGTITVLTKDAGGATDIAANEDMKISLWVLVCLYKNMDNQY